MQMDAGMDTGAMLKKRAVPIDERWTAGALHDRLARVGAELLAEALPELVRGTLVPEPQDDAQATMAPLLDKEVGRLDFSRGARAVRDRARGCEPWPGAFTQLSDGTVLKVFGAKLVSGRGTPGAVLGADRDGLLVACGEDAVAFAELQLPGKKRMSAQALLAGHPMPPGTLLGK
jgi:methionyl-tRNA formyltransferase